LYTIPSESDVEPDDGEPVASTPVSCSGDVAVNTGNSLSIVPQSERETQEFGVQLNSQVEEANGREEGIDRHVWTGYTPRSYYYALQVNLERIAEAQFMIGMFERNMNVNDLAEWVTNDVGVVDLPQRRMCHFAVQYAAQVLRIMSGHYIRGMDARSLLVEPMPCLGNLWLGTLLMVF